MTYKYHLDKTSKKFQCPKCHKKTFVRFVDYETQQYMDSHYGRCDRESKCAYFCSPKGNVKVSDSSVIPLIVKPDYHDLSLVHDCMKSQDSNNFVTYLFNDLKGMYSRKHIQAVLDRYFIGNINSWIGDTIFWQIDEKLKVHGGKVMLYDEHTGKRVKSPYPHVTWMHRVLQKRNPVLHGKTFNLKQCLFGLHTLHDSLEKTIAIVESEKTAVMMSIYIPEMLWMATGSKSNFKYELLEPLKGRNILAYPDKSEYVDWKKEAGKMKVQGLNVTCPKFMEYTNLGDGADLVDLFSYTRIAA